MRSVDTDLTARAAIRNAALRLFAEHGPDAVTVRQIANEADVSAALVLHHFGNKAGLRDAVDAFAFSAFEELLDPGNTEELAELMTSGDGRSIAEALAGSFPPDSPLPAYLRRLLLAGDPVGERLFQHWYEGTKQLFEAMVDSGLAAPGKDLEVRTAFLLANDLALILLRGPIESAIGSDPLRPDGMERWAEEVATVYREGLWATSDKYDE